VIEKATKELEAMGEEFDRESKRDLQQQQHNNSNSSNRRRSLHSTTYHWRI